MSRLIRAIVLAGALLLVLSACGGGTAGTTTPTLPTLSQETADEDAAAATTTTEAVDPEEAFQRYTACMQEQGIEMPDVGSDGDGGVITIQGDGDMDFSAFEEAAAICDPLLEAAFGEFELSPEQEAEMMDQELAFAQCMRDNGVDWPDPSSDGSNMIELGDDLDPETVDAAIETCSKEAFGDIGGFAVSGETP